MPLDARRWEGDQRKTRERGKKEERKRGKRTGLKTRHYNGYYNGRNEKQEKEGGEKERV